jgi:hypothetical protein
MITSSIYKVHPPSMMIARTVNYTKQMDESIKQIAKKTHFKSFVKRKVNNNILMC